MKDVENECVICRGTEGDKGLRRIEVWQTRSWRLTVSVDSQVMGFSYLEPKRHISDITELDGAEARAFGEVLARATRALRNATQAETVYVYIFGTGIPHLHVHLAPHRRGDALNAEMIKGKVVTEELASGAERYISVEFPLISERRLRRVAERIRGLMSA